MKQPCNKQPFFATFVRNITAFIFTARASRNTLSLSEHYTRQAQLSYMDDIACPGLLQYPHSSNSTSRSPAMFRHRAAGLQRPRGLWYRFLSLIVIVVTITFWQAYTANARAHLVEYPLMRRGVGNNGFHLELDDQEPWQRNHPIHWMRVSFGKYDRDTTTLPISKPPHPKEAADVIRKQPVEPIEQQDVKGRTGSSFTPLSEQVPVSKFKTTTFDSEYYTFPAYTECTALQEKADTLPDLLFVPFEQAVEDIEMMGWEDMWVAEARYNGPKLLEPRIDFVYNCMDPNCV